MEQGISKQKIINDIEFLEPPGYDKIKGDKVNVSYVQATIGRLVTKMNSDLVSALNTQLEENGAKLTKLTGEVGSADGGLIQSVTNLGSRITGLETEKTVGEDIWG